MVQGDCTILNARVGYKGLLKRHFIFFIVNELQIEYFFSSFNVLLLERSCLKVGSSSYDFVH